MKAVAEAIAIVSNPAGAKEESAELRELLDSRNIDVTWLDTTEDDPGTGQSAAAVADGADTVIACGGDGTVRACIESLVGTETVLGVIPAGTGNLLARNLDIPDTVEGAFDCATSGKIATIDVGRFNGEAFAVMAGVGFDGTVMTDTSRESKERFGALAYVATALRHLEDRSFGATISVDGAPVFSGRAKSVLVGNMGHLQGGVDLFPDGKPDDGVLEVLVLRPEGLWGWVWTAWSILTRRRNAATLDRWSGTSGQIALDGAQPYQLDGDERDPAREFEFTVQPKSLNLRRQETSQ